MSKRPAQPGQPAHVWPAATWSNNSGGRTRVPTSLTWPRQVGFGFPLLKHVKLDLPFKRFIKHSKPNSAKSCRDLVQILRDPVISCVVRWNLGQILTNSTRFRLDLDGFGQISAPVIKPETDPIKLETDETQTRRSDQIIRTSFGLYYPWFKNRTELASPTGWTKNQPLVWSPKN